MNSSLFQFLLWRYQCPKKFQYNTMAVYIIEYFLLCQRKQQNISARLISVRCSNSDILKCFNNYQYSKKEYASMLCKCFWESALLGQHPKKLYISIYIAAFWNTLSKVSKWSKRKICGTKFSACMCMVIFCQNDVALFNSPCIYWHCWFSAITIHQKLIFCEHDVVSVSFQKAWWGHSQIFAGMVCFLRV